MHRKELAVLAVVGALVLWGGAAAAVQAPANQATADATDGVTALQEDDDVDQNETTTENDTAGNDSAGMNETTESDAQADDEDGNETATDEETMNETAEANESGLAITSVEAPAYIPSNESFEVSANLTNTGDEEHSEEVAYRLEGGGVDVVMHENVTLAPGESQNVTFQVDENLTEEDYIHGITTYNSSEFNELTVSDDALVSFEDQEADGNNVTVEYAYVPEGGYVTVHDSSLLEGEVVGSVVGVSEYLEPGWHNDVNVTLYEGVEGAEFNQTDLGENATFVAMPHMETNDNQTYDFVATEGEADGAYVTDGVPVTDAANVSGVEGVQGAPTDEADNETTTEDEQTTEAPTDDEQTTEDNESDVGPTPITDGEDNASGNETTEEPAAPDNGTDENATDDGMADNATDGEPAAPGNDTMDNETDGEPVAPGNDTADNGTDGEPAAPDDNESDESDDGVVIGGDTTNSGGSDTETNGTDGDGAGTDSNATDTGTEDNTTDTGTEDNTTDTGTEDNTTDTGTEDNTTDTGAGDETTEGEMTTTASGNETATDETTTEAGA